MTNAQKQKVLASVYTLYEAHQEIKNYLDNNNPLLAKNILIQCQKVAIALGTYIEELEEDAYSVISILEEYCETVFQIYEALNCNLFCKSKVYKLLKRKLTKLENSIKNEISTKIEIVFLPYKASMWDSFESIYFAAKEDPNCNACCVPIPYFDINADHSLGVMHYEIKDYPDYIETINWLSYNIEDRKPDVVYIHNPYDDQNYVTTVHPRYYSKNLKKYTASLVYVPYNVTGGTLCKMHRQLLSYINIDHIILQNERQISLLASEFSTKACALGSPKFDRVINTTITKEMIPEDWKPKLKETIIFLNTGINGLLKHNQKSLLKIQYILEVAKSKNVTLLWRPHPLLEATIHSLRPELWELYCETVEKFCTYENSILDRTGNAELAIGLSDVYIGEDTSSISHMFGVLGKPLFFIQQKILKEENGIENIKISCLASDPENNDMLWASAANRNLLIRVSEQGMINEFYIIPGEKDTSNLYCDILIVQGKIYLIPRNAKAIAIFDIKSKQFSKIALLKPGKKEKFNKGFLYENTIYLIPRLYEAMVTLDCINGGLHYCTEIVNKLKEITQIPDILVSANGILLDGQCLYLSAPNKPCILEYNLKTQKTEIHIIQGINTGFCCIEKVSDKIVLGSMGSCELAVWDSVHKTTRVIKDFPEGWKKDEEISFWNIIELDGDAYIFPRTNPMILKLSVKDYSLVQLKQRFPFSIQDRKSNFYNHPNHFLFVKKLSNGKVVVQDANRHGISEFYTDGTFKWNPVALTDENELQALKASFSRQSSNLPWGVYESKYYSVRRLVSYVRCKMHDKDLQKKAFLDAAVNLDGTAGQKIHEFVIKALKK